MRHLQISARSFYAVRASQRGPLPRQERSLHLLASELCGLAAAEVLGRVTVSRFASGLTAVTWSYWQLIRQPAAFLYGFHIARGWMSIPWLFLGRLCGDDDHPLLLLAALLWADDFTSRRRIMVLSSASFGFACRGEHCECSMVCVSPPCRERAPALSVMDGGRCLLAWGRPQECYISSDFTSY